MPNWVDEQFMRQHFEDLVREEQLHRLSAAAASMRSPRPRFYGRMLAGFGRWLVIWGGRLEARYSAMIDPPIITVNGKPISGR